MISYLKNIVSRFIFFAITLMLIACGSDSGGGNELTGVQMGGAIQGKPLTLSTNVTTFVGTAGVSGSDDGIGAEAQFYYPWGITTDGTYLYITDNHSIRKIVIVSGKVTTLAGTAGSFGSADGTGTDARFFDPRGITTDGINLYVVDSKNHTIRKIVIATGEVTTFSGTVGSSGSADGIGAAAQFYLPDNITTDGTSLFVTEPYNHTIRQIVITTGEVTTLAGTAGLSGSDDGTGAEAQFDTPTGITTDGTNLYINSYNAVRKIVINTGVVTTLAGITYIAESTDGTGDEARFSAPADIITDGTNLYVTDNNSVVRKIIIATYDVSTLAGDASSLGSADEVGSAARFNIPIGITTDGAYLYVVDQFNHTIRKIN